MKFYNIFFTFILVCIHYKVNAAEKKSTKTLPPKYVTDCRTITSTEQSINYATATIVNEDNEKEPVNVSEISLQTKTYKDCEVHDELCQGGIKRIGHFTTYFTSYTRVPCPKTVSFENGEDIVNPYYIGGPELPSEEIESYKTILNLRASGSSPYVGRTKYNNETFYMVGSNTLFCIQEFYEWGTTASYEYHCSTKTLPLEEIYTPIPTEAPVTSTIDDFEPTPTMDIRSEPTEIVNPATTTIVEPISETPSPKYVTDCRTITSTEKSINYATATIVNEDNEKEPVNVSEISLQTKTYKDCEVHDELCQGGIKRIGHFTTYFTSYTRVPCPKTVSFENGEDIVNPYYIGGPELPSEEIESYKTILNLRASGSSPYVGRTKYNNETFYMVGSNTLFCIQEFYEWGTTASYEYHCSTKTLPLEEIYTPIPTEAPVTSTMDNFEPTPTMDISSEPTEIVNPATTTIVEPISETPSPKYVTDCRTITSTEKSINYATATIVNEDNEKEPVNVSEISLQTKTYKDCEVSDELCQGGIKRIGHFTTYFTSYTRVPCPKTVSFENGEDIVNPYYIGGPELPSEEIESYKTILNLRASGSSPYVGRTKYNNETFYMVGSNTLFCIQEFYEWGTTASYEYHCSTKTLPLEEIYTLIPTEAPVTSTIDDFEPTSTIDLGSEPTEITDATSTSTNNCENVTITVTKKVKNIVTKKETVTVTVFKNEPTVTSCAKLWEQCGGENYQGPTCCSEGTCHRVNQYYSQCI